MGTKNGDVEIIHYDDVYNIKLSGVKGGKYEFTIRDENDIEHSFEYYFDKEENTVLLKKKTS